MSNWAKLEVCGTVLSCEKSKTGNFFGKLGVMVRVEGRKPFEKVFRFVGEKELTVNDVATLRGGFKNTVRSYFNEKNVLSFTTETTVFVDAEVDKA